MNGKVPGPFVFGVAKVKGGAIGVPLITLGVARVVSVRVESPWMIFKNLTNPILFYFDKFGLAVQEKEMCSLYIYIYIVIHIYTLFYVALNCWSQWQGATQFSSSPCAFWQETWRLLPKWLDALACRHASPQWYLMDWCKKCRQHRFGFKMLWRFNGRIWFHTNAQTTLWVQLFVWYRLIIYQRCWIVGW